MTDEEFAELKQFHAVNAVADGDEEDLGLWDVADVYNEMRRHLRLVPKLLAEVERLRAELANVLASAVPNERDHPTMSKAWKRAEAFLAGEGDE